MNLSLKKFNQLVLAFLFIFPFGSAFAISHSVPIFKASYRLSHNDIEIGRVELSVRATTNTQYQLRSSTQTSGLLAFVRDDDVVETSQFELTPEHIRPLAYQYKQTLGDEHKDIRLQFDWQNARLTNTSKGHVWTLPISKGVLDKALMQIALMLDMKTAEQSFSYQIADGGKLKKYTFTRLGTERITIAGRSLNTIKLARKKDDKPLITYYWCAEDLHHLPVLIQRKKSYGTFEMRLLNVRFSD